MSWSLGALHPEAAWAAGATGQGIKVAVIDSGVDSATPDLTGQITSDSIDIIASRPADDPLDRHGTYVAGIIAANFNSAGSLGVAYEADILSIRIDPVGACTTECGYTSSNIASAIDYAISRGARVINLSLGADTPSGFTVEQALRRATDAGIVVVASAGNDGEVDPNWPARYAVDSRYSGHIVAVGALARNGSIASFSNRAGVAQAGYLVAPGDDIITDCDLTGCWIVSGTSFSAPQVSGAMALLLQGFPNLTGQQAVDILLQTATDLGATGTDSIYGRGSLDIQAAFQPIGPLNVPTTQGASFSADPGHAPLLSAAFGDALSAPSALTTVGYDDYQRLFTINAGGFYRVSAGSSAAGPAPPTEEAQIDRSLAGGGRLRVSVRREIAPQRGLVSPPGGDMALSYAGNGLRFDVRNGGAAGGGFEAAPADAFSALAGAGSAGRLGYDLGRWTFSAEQGQATRNDNPGHRDTLIGVSANEVATRYGRLSASWRGERSNTAFALGRLSEEGGPLGSFAPAGTYFSLPAQTQFVSLRQEWRPTGFLILSAEGALGRTQATGRLLSIDDGVSSSWRLTATTSCRQVGLGCDGLSVSLAQPLRFEGGYATAVLADVPKAYFDELTYSARYVGLSPSGRELDLSLTAWRAVEGLGTLQLQGYAALQPGHRKDARRIWPFAELARRILGGRWVGLHPVEQLRVDALELRH